MAGYEQSRASQSYVSAGHISMLFEGYGTMPITPRQVGSMRFPIICVVEDVLKQKGKVTTPKGTIDFVQVHDAAADKNIHERIFDTFDGKPLCTIQELGDSDNLETCLVTLHDVTFDSYSLKNWHPVYVGTRSQPTMLCTVANIYMPDPVLQNVLYDTTYAGTALNK